MSGQQDGGRGHGRGGNQGGGGIYLEGHVVNQPDQSVKNAEDILVNATRGRMIDGFPGRKGYGTQGKKIVLRTNYFPVTTAADDNSIPYVVLYKYEVEVIGDISKPKRRRLIELILGRPLFSGIDWATDYAKIVVTTKKLGLTNNQFDDKVTLPAESIQQPQQGQQGPIPDFVHNARARNTFSYKITYKNSYSVGEIVRYLQDTSAGAAYAGRTEVVQLLNIIIAKEPNARVNIQNVGQNKFYPFSNHQAVEQSDLGYGLRALRGYYASVRPATRRLLLNLNVSSGAFYKPLPLIDLLREVRGSVQQQEIFIRMLKVQVRYPSGMTKLKTIVGFAKEPPNPTFRVKRFGNANEVKFRYSTQGGQSREISVAQYFLEHYQITLRRSDLPVLNVGTHTDPQYLPQELCIVIDGQPYRRLLSGDQTTAMLHFAARPPNLNAISIAGTPANPGIGLRLMRLVDPNVADLQATNIAKFGFRIGPLMLTVPGRILPSPKVTYANRELVTSRGSWSSAHQKFIKPGRFNSWAVLLIHRAGSKGQTLSHGNAHGLISELENYLKGYGLQMGTRHPTMKLDLEELTEQNRQSNDRKLRDMMQKQKDLDVNILFIILPEADKWLYARIKYCGDVEFGIHTICSVGNKLQKPKNQGMYMGNLALKFNLKGGGVSHSVPRLLQGGVVDANTILMGIDVTHPSPGSAENAPSIACVVASINGQMFQWPGSIRTRTARKEIVGNNGNVPDNSIAEMVKERLDLWHKVNGRYPSKIILYRDGVSEGQYSQVLTYEMGPIDSMLAEVYGNNKPKTAVIIVGKRHHTRFYPTNKNDADFTSWNPQPGTIVDRLITNKVLRDFYLQAHQGLQGTARPAHYVVIKDDVGFSADALEDFTHKLCYLFNRATKAVSVCPPAYYADLLCARGRAYLYKAFGENHGSDSSVFNPADEWSGEIHDKIKNSTWYV